MSGTRTPATSPASKGARGRATPRLEVAGAAATLTPTKAQGGRKMSGPSMPEDAGTPGTQHLEGYRYDLNPEFGEGADQRLLGQHPEKASGARTAYDIKR